MFTNGPGVDPQSHLGNWRATEIARRANNWAGGNAPRWASAEYDALYQELETASLEQERRDLIIRLNDLLVQNDVLIPLVNRATVSSAVSSDLKGVRLTPWDAELWNVHEWYR